MKKRVLSLLLSILMLVSLVPISSITASANENDIVVYGFSQVLPNQTVEEWKATRPGPISFSVDIIPGMADFIEADISTYAEFKDYVRTHDRYFTGSVFEEGKTYTAFIAVIPQGEYVLPENANIICESATSTHYERVEEPDGSYVAFLFIKYVLGKNTCTKHNYKTTTTKATLSKNGSITKKCTVCGNVVTSTINSPKTFKLEKSSYTYDGKTKEPTVKVYDKAGELISASNYTVSYKNNKNVGKATAIITFKDNYSGNKTISFTINPKAASINKLTAKKKALSVKLNKTLKQSTGYEIQYSTSKKFKSAKKVTIKSYKTSTTTLKKLKAKKTYYVRVRTYKTVGKTKYYSNWSNYKSKKTK